MNKLLTPAAILIALGGAVAWAQLSSPIQSTGPYRGTPVTASATGTTAVVTVSIPAVPNVTAHLCGFSIRSNAPATVDGEATVTGLVSGTLNFLQQVAAAPAVGVVEPPLGPACIPAGTTNSAITVNSIAAGAGGFTSVSLWGFYL